MRVSAELPCLAFPKTSRSQNSKPIKVTTETFEDERINNYYHILQKKTLPKVRLMNNY
jgi:hypothetical protein